MINFQLKENKLKIGDNPEISIWKELINEYELQNRESVTQKEYEKIMYRVVYSYSIHLLSKKDYFSCDLKNKLKKIFFNKGIIEIVVEELKNKGYVDDLSMAQQYVKNHEKYGRKKIEYTLKQKGINLTEVKSCLDDNNENEIKEIEKILDKSKDKPLEKTITSLMRKGFEYKSIKLVLDRRK